MWNPGQRSRAQEHAPRRSRHQTGGVRRRRCPFIARVRATRNNVKIKHGYYLLLRIVDLHRKHSISDAAFLHTFCTEVNNTQQYVEMRNDENPLLHHHYKLLLYEK